MHLLKGQVSENYFESTKNSTAGYIQLNATAKSPTDQSATAFKTQGRSGLPAGWHSLTPLPSFFPPGIVRAQPLSTMISSSPSAVVAAATAEKSSPPSLNAEVVELQQQLQLLKSEMKVMQTTTGTSQRHMTIPGDLKDPSTFPARPPAMDRSPDSEAGGGGGEQSPCGTSISGISDSGRVGSSNPLKPSTFKRQSKKSGEGIVALMIPDSLKDELTSMQLKMDSLVEFKEKFEKNLSSSAAAADTQQSPKDFSTADMLPTADTSSKLKLSEQSRYQRNAPTLSHQQPPLIPPFSSNAQVVNKINEVIMRTFQENPNALHSFTLKRKVQPVSISSSDTTTSPSPVLSSLPSYEVRCGMRFNSYN